MFIILCNKCNVNSIDPKLKYIHISKEHKRENESNKNKKCVF